MSEVKETAKKASVYILGMFMNQAASFIMLPIYTRYLTPAMYGTMEILTLSISVIGLVVGLGVRQSFSRMYYEYKDEQDKKEYMVTAYLLVLLVHAAVCAVGLYFSGHLGEVLLTGTAEDAYGFRIAFFLMLVGALYDIPLLFIQVQQRAFLYVGITFSSLVVQLTLNILFVVYYEMGIFGVLYSTLIAKGVLGFVVSLYYFRHAGVISSWEKCVEIVSYAVPLVFSGLGNFIITFADRFFLKAYVDLAAVGIYSLGYKLGFLMIEIGFNPIYKSWEPKRFKLADSDDFVSVNKSVFLLVTVSVVSFSLFFSLFAKDFFRIVSAPSYWSAYKVVPYVMLAYIFQSWAMMCNFAMFKFGRTKAFGTIGMAVAGLFCLLCYVLIPQFGIMGAAWATIVAMFSRFALLYTMTQRFYPLDYGWSKLLMVLCTAIVVYVLAMNLEIENRFLSVAYYAGVFCVYLSAIWVLPIATAGQKKIVKEFVVEKVGTYLGARA